MLVDVNFLFFFWPWARNLREWGIIIPEVDGPAARLFLGADEFNKKWVYAASHESIIEAWRRHFNKVRSH